MLSSRNLCLTTKLRRGIIVLSTGERGRKNGADFLRDVVVIINNILS